MANLTFRVQTDRGVDLCTKLCTTMRVREVTKGYSSGKQIPGVLSYVIAGVLPPQHNTS